MRVFITNDKETIENETDTPTQKKNAEQKATNIDNGIVSECVTCFNNLKADCFNKY